jgi:hypothetical protein
MVTLEGLSSSSSCYQLSHSNIAIGPSPHWNGRRREHCLEGLLGGVVHVHAIQLACGAMARPHCIKPQGSGVPNTA